MRVYLSPSKQPHNWSALPWISEEDLMREVTAHIAEELYAWPGFEVRIHQGRTIQTAVEEGNAWPADVYVAPHSNAAPAEQRGKSRGTETYYHTPGYPGEMLAACIHAEILAAFGCVNRGIKDLSKAPVPFYEIIKPTMTSVLVETLFHDNIGEAYLLERCAEEMGIAIATGIVTFCEWRFGAVSKPLAARSEAARLYIPVRG